MDRTPEHLTEDPLLRVRFVSQQSWDEWASEHAPFFLVPEARELVEAEMQRQGLSATYEDALAVATEEWQSTLDPETNISELLYLQGRTHTQRSQIIEQQHRELLNRAVEMGLVEEREEDADFRKEFGE